MRHGRTAGDDVDVEHHQAAAELQDAAMAVDRAGLGLAHEVDAEIGGAESASGPPCESTQT
jgi:hypothetical protein